MGRNLHWFLPINIFSQTEKQSEAEFRKAVPAHQYFSQAFFKRRSYSTTYKLIENYAGVEF